MTDNYGDMSHLTPQQQARALEAIRQALVERRASSDDDQTPPPNSTTQE